MSCEGCDAFAPLKIWNATSEWLAARAANIKAAGHAYFHDDGRWYAIEPAPALIEAQIAQWVIG